MSQRESSREFWLPSENSQISNIIISLRDVACLSPRNSLIRELRKRSMIINGYATRGPGGIAGYHFCLTHRLSSVRVRVEAFIIQFDFIHRSFSLGCISSKSQILLETFIIVRKRPLRVIGNLPLLFALPLRVFRACSRKSSNILEMRHKM